MEQGVCFFSFPFTWHCSIILVLKVIYWHNAVYYCIVLKSHHSQYYFSKNTLLQQILLFEENVSESGKVLGRPVLSHLSIPSSFLQLKINVSSARFTSILNMNIWLFIPVCVLTLILYSSFRVYFYGLCWTLQTDFTMIHLVLLNFFLPQKANPVWNKWKNPSNSMLKETGNPTRNTNF